MRPLFSKKQCLKKKTSPYIPANTALYDVFTEG
jgi:hypothetical protein